MGKKAAIVIGVDKPGPLPKLNSPAAGAVAVCQWLESEGFVVKCLTDQQAPVNSSQVKGAIKELVTNPPRYSLLVVYFSGHGYWQARADRWLLSGAPVDTSEAINLDGAMDLARYSGIPNVVFISDACRSIPDSRSGALVEGIDAFPNYTDIDQVSKVDCFRATTDAQAAYEGLVDGRQQSVLTYALLSAYEKPAPDMVREVIEGTQTILVVPNRRLESFLQQKIDAILAAINPTFSQRIEVNVPSSDDVYIARVRTAPPTDTHAKPSPVPPAPPAPVVAAAAIARSLSTPLTGADAAVQLLMKPDSDLEKEVTRRLPDLSVDHFESETGFVVRGARVERALVALHGLNFILVPEAFVLERGDGQTLPGIIRINAQEPASVLLELDDERSVVIACLPGYIGHATFDKTGMSNVSYVPSSNNYRWYDYKTNRDHLDRLRAMVAVAVEGGTFYLNSNEQANELAARIRTLKAIDPTLGLYSAVAYSQAGNDDGIASVMEYMREDLKADLFDVRMLVTRAHSDQASSVPVVPFCPLLTQSWNLLRPRGIALSRVMQNAIPSLCNSLWTTFEPPATRTIFQAVESGNLR